MPSHARVWLYASDRAFSAQEERAINNLLADFVSQWNSHGNPLTAAFAIIDHQLIILAVDESVTAPSGCSIDKSVALLRRIEAQTGTVLLDGGRVFYQSDNGLEVLRLPQIKQAVETRRINENTLILNMQAKSLEEARCNLWIPAAGSWMARYFKQPA